jgi:hypothetical protein
MMRPTLVARVAALLSAHPAQDGHDEQTAARKLGYVLRADHPWRPLNRQRPCGVEPSGSLGERGFEGASDSTG